VTYPDADPAGWLPPDPLVAEVERLTVENQRLRELCEGAARLLAGAAEAQALVVMDTAEDRERNQMHVEVLARAAAAIRMAS
jgi:hypothetical protein